MRCVVIGESESRRVQLFNEALGKRGIEPVLVSYLDLIGGKTDLRSIVLRDDFVRIESPGKDFEVERALLMEGVSKLSSEEDSISFAEIQELKFDRGLILPQSQWYRGWCILLRKIREQLLDAPEHFLMNSAGDIATLFDKIACDELLRSAGVRLPNPIGRISSFDDLVEKMSSANCRRVFIKPAHSSSASGIVAYESNGRKHQAHSTVEIVRDGDSVKLYNSRRVRKYVSFEEIKFLVDQLAVHNLFAQYWYPKAGLKGNTFDLRVLVIAGRAKHIVVRESKTPFTNLHLLNARGDVSLVEKAMGEQRFASLLETCEEAAAVFAGCLYVGVDVLVSPDFKSHAVAEVNAFGDLLPDVLHEGLSTYEAELDAICSIRETVLRELQPHV